MSKLLLGEPVSVNTPAVVTVPDKTASTVIRAIHPSYDGAPVAGKVTVTHDGSVVETFHVRDGGQWSRLYSGWDIGRGVVVITLSAVPDVFATLSVETD